MKVAVAHNHLLVFLQLKFFGRGGTLVDSMLLDRKVVGSNPILAATPGCLGKSFTNSIYNIIYIIYCIDQWFPNCEPRLPWEPWLPPRGAAQFFKKNLLS